MKIVAINGSPRGKKGVTALVLEHFISGIEETGNTVQTIELPTKKIHHCIGDLSCWFKTPGQCIFEDDMKEILQNIISADSIIIATPVYVDGMTGLLKNAIDRLVPMVDPHFEFRDGHCRHVPNIAKKRKLALVSTCGFYELDNFDPLVAHIKAICKNLDADYAGAVLRPAAPMLPEIPTLHPLFFKLRSIKKAIALAGKEFATSGRISDEAMQGASQDIISKEMYFEKANESFDKILEEIKR